MTSVDLLEQINLRSLWNYYMNLYLIEMVDRFMVKRRLRFVYGVHVCWC